MQNFLRIYFIRHVEYVARVTSETSPNIVVVVISLPRSRKSDTKIEVYLQEIDLSLIWMTHIVLAGPVQLPGCPH